MKWKAAQEPKIGDIKKRKWFAIIPVKIENEWIWLEFYYRVYEYSICKVLDRQYTGEDEYCKYYKKVWNDYLAWWFIKREKL